MSYRPTFAELVMVELVGILTLSGIVPDIWIGLFPVSATKNYSHNSSNFPVVGRGCRSPLSILYASSPWSLIPDFPLEFLCCFSSRDRSVSGFFSHFQLSVVDAIAYGHFSYLAVVQKGVWRLNFDNICHILMTQIFSVFVVMLLFPVIDHRQSYCLWARRGWFFLVFSFKT